MKEILGTYLLLILIGYFFPFIISLLTGNRRTSVFLINLFLGWTFLGWVWAIIWAFTSEAKPSQVIVHNHITTDKQNNQDTAPQFASIPQVNSTKNKQEEILNSHQTKISQLKHLKELLDNGILTQDEFATQKSKILTA